MKYLSWSLTLAVLWHTPLLGATPFGSTIALGVSRAATGTLKSATAMEADASSPLGFSKGISTGQNFQFDRYRSVRGKLGAGGHIGLSTFSEERSGTTNIANILHISPQLKRIYSLGSDTFLFGFAGAGLTFVHRKELTRDDSSESRSIQPGLRAGTGIQVQRVQLRLERNALYSSTQSLFRWFGVNFGYAF